MNTETLWIECPIPYEDLKDKTVEFRLATGGGVVSGVGYLRARVRPSGEMAIDIEITESVDPYSKNQIRFHIAQAAIQFLQVHPDKEKADFKFFAA